MNAYKEIEVDLKCFGLQKKTFWALFEKTYFLPMSLCDMHSELKAFLRRGLRQYLLALGLVQNWPLTSSVGQEI